MKRTTEFAAAQLRKASKLSDESPPIESVEKEKATS